MRTTHRLLVSAVASSIAGITVAVAMTGGVVVTNPVTTGQAHVTIFHGSGLARGGECTGTLLADRWVLTGAHCVEPLADDFVAGGVRREPDRTKVWGRGVPLAGVWAPDAAMFVVAGWTVDVPAPSRPALWAFDRSGAIPVVDGAPFGTSNGITDPPLEGVDGARLSAVVALPDGGFAAAGFAEVNGVDHTLVMTYDARGRVVRSSFPTASAAVAFPPRQGRALDLVLDPTTGDLVIVGWRDDAVGATRWLAARYSVDGQPRPAYAYLDEGGDGPTGQLRDVAVVGGRVVVLAAREVGLEGAVHTELAVLGDEALLTPAQPIEGWGELDEARVIVADSYDRVVVVGHDATHDRLMATRHGVPSLIGDVTFGDEGVASFEHGDPTADVTVVDATYEESFDAAGADHSRIIVGLTYTDANPTTAPSLMVFDRHGQPDVRVGQGGFVRWHSQVDVYASALALAPRNALFVGVTMKPVAPVAVGFDLTPDLVPAHAHVRLGYQYRITEVRRHHDPRLDAALVKLDRPIDHASALRFGSFVDPSTLAHERRVTCYGYGDHDGPDDDLLRSGDFYVDTIDPHHVYLGQICPAAGCSQKVPHGDSGGGCFLEVGGSGPTLRQIGVTEAFAMPSGKNWDAKAARRVMVRPDVITEWIASVIERPVHPPLPAGN